MIDFVSLAWTIVAVIVVTGTAGYVAWPLWQARPRRLAAARPPTASKLADLLDERRRVLGALRELDRDHALGALTSDDYAALSATYEASAATIYRQLDAATLSRAAALDAEVERERRRLHVTLNGRSPLAELARFSPTVRLGDIPAAEFVANRLASVSGAPPGSVPDELAESERQGNLADRRTEPVGARRGTPIASAQPTAGRLTPIGRGARRSLLLAIGAAVASAAFVLVIGGLYLRANQARAEQSPIASVPTAGLPSLYLDPAVAGRAYLGTPTGLLVSETGGRFWALVPNVGAEITAVARVGASLLAAGPNVYLRSDDNGSTWRSDSMASPGQDVRALAASPASRSRLYAAVVGEGIRRSDDAGATWTTVGRAPIDPRSLAVVPSPGGDALYAVGAEQGVLVSRDGGRSWGSASGFVNGALPTRQAFAIVYDPRSGDSARSAVGAFDGALLVATDRGLFRSIDGGGSWSRLPLEASTVVVGVDPADSRIVVAIDRAGQVYRSRDRGLTWDDRA